MREVRRKGGREKIQNSKHEIRNSKQIQMTKMQVSQRGLTQYASPNKGEEEAM